MNIDSYIQRSMLERDTNSLLVFRQLKTAASNILSAKGRLNKELSQDEWWALIRKQINQRDESIVAFEKGGKKSLADCEREEQKILAALLPKSLTEEEMDDLVSKSICACQASIKKDIGRVMDYAKELSGGSADPKVLAKKIAALMN